MWRQAAAQVHPLDLPEFGIREDRCKLQGMVKGEGDTGGLEIKKSEFHNTL